MGVSVPSEIGTGMFLQDHVLLPLIGGNMYVYRAYILVVSVYITQFYNGGAGVT